MKVVTAAEMREIDRITIEEYGMPASMLMGFAGKAIAGYLREAHPSARRVAFVCGMGNNGGDGFVAAYFFMQAEAGLEPHIFITGDLARMSAETRLYYDLCVRTGIPCTPVVDTAGFPDLRSFDCIIDALLGTGVSGPVKGILAELIETINASGVPVIAADMPSGLPAGGESPEGPVVRASATVTMGLPKIALVTYPGKEYAGTCIVADIGFPAALTESSTIKTELIDKVYAGAKLRSPLHPDTHKSARGHLLLVGGFDGMEGAIMMTAMAALETGVGLITVLTTAAAREVIAGKIPELITTEIPSLKKIDTHDLGIAIDDVFRTHRYNALVLGPGMGRSEEAAFVFGHIMDSLNDYNVRRVLIDGDGLFHLAAYLDENNLDERVGYVITPHFLEASRILDRDVESIKKNRMQATRELCEKTSAISLLKGPSTLVSDGVFTLVNTSGNPALATAGSGDVLSGIIGALLLSGQPVAESAAIGAYIHGAAADLFCEAHNGISMKATDIISYIRPVLQKLM